MIIPSPNVTGVPGASKYRPKVFQEHSWNTHKVAVSPFYLGERHKARPEKPEVQPTIIKRIWIISKWFFARPSSEHRKGQNILPSDSRFNWHRRGKFFDDAFQVESERKISYRGRKIKIDLARSLFESYFLPGTFLGPSWNFPYMFEHHSYRLWACQKLSILLWRPRI